MEKTKIEKAKDTWEKIEAMYNDKKLVKKFSIAFFFVGIALFMSSIMMNNYGLGAVSGIFRGLGLGFIVLFIVGYLIMNFVHHEDLLDTIFKMFDKKKKKEESL